MGFKLAFGVREFNSESALDDPNFVQWNVALITSINSVIQDR
jgi:hypothetical protein